MVCSWMGKASMMPFPARASTMSDAMPRSLKVVNILPVGIAGNVSAPCFYLRRTAAGPSPACTLQPIGDCLRASDRLCPWCSGRIGAVRAPRRRACVPRVAPTELAKVDFTELVPEPVPFLGQAAYIQLEFFESLAEGRRDRAHAAREGGTERRGRRRAAQAPRAHRRAPPARRRARRRDGAVRAGHRSLPPGDAPAPTGTSCCSASTSPPACSTTTSRGSPRACPSNSARAFARSSTRRARRVVLESELRAAIAARPGARRPARALGAQPRRRHAAHRAVGAARVATRPDRAGEQVEPVFTELIAEHTRRMDALGLTA